MTCSLLQQHHRKPPYVSSRSASAILRFQKISVATRTCASASAAKAFRARSDCPIDPPFGVLRTFASQPLAFSLHDPELIAIMSRVDRSVAPKVSTSHRPCLLAAKMAGFPRLFSGIRFMPFQKYDLPFIMAGATVRNVPPPRRHQQSMGRHAKYGCPESQLQFATADRNVEPWRVWPPHFISRTGCLNGEPALARAKPWHTQPHTSNPMLQRPMHFR